MRRLSTPFSVGLAMALAGLVGGWLSDDLPVRPIQMRGDYHVIETDFHVHTRFSDGFLSPFDVVTHAERQGLQAIAITEHNILVAGRLARWFSELVDGPIVILGQEVTSDRFHLHAVGTSEYVHWDQSPADVIAAIHAQGGVAIAAHPVLHYWPIFEPVLGELDGTEVMHPLAFGGRGDDDPENPWSWRHLRDFYLNAGQSGHQLAAIGASDYHFFGPIGICRTLVFAESPTADGIVDAVREARTVVYDLDGRAYGDPDMIALLQADPYEWLEIDYNYGSTTRLDRVSRAMSWFGLLGMLALARRRPESSEGNE